MRVEVRLRVPNMKKRVLNIDGYPIDHADLRFRKIIAVPRVPRLGETLDLETQSGRSLKATVARVELDEPRELFIVACQYAARVITLDDYSALADDPEWELKHLLDP
jgi:hypothetical protein